jgi:predicted ATPase
LRREEALAEARRRLPFDLAEALCFAWLGDWARDGVKSAPTMAQAADEVLAISSEHGFAYFFGLGNVMRGWSLGAIGQTAEGIPLVRQGMDICGATGASLDKPWHLTALAEVYEMAGLPAEGLARLADAAELIERTQERWAEAGMHRVRATLMLAMNQHAAAEEAYYQAVTVARRQSAKLWELRAATGLARLWRGQGKRAEARDLLAPVYGWFTEGFDTPVLQDAKALLGELG